jgi:hypothetical protein
MSTWTCFIISEVGRPIYIENLSRLQKEPRLMFFLYFILLNSLFHPFSDGNGSNQLQAGLQSRQ